MVDAISTSSIVISIVVTLINIFMILYMVFISGVRLYLDEEDFQNIADKVVDKLSEHLKEAVKKTKESDEIPQEAKRKPIVMDEMREYFLEQEKIRKRNLNL